MTRSPLYDDAAERAVLGAILGDPAGLGQVGSTLFPEDFQVDVHRDTYQVVRELTARGSGVDGVTVADGLAARGYALDRARETITALLNDSNGSHNLSDYAEIVALHSQRRRGRAVGQELLGLMEDPAKDPRESLNTVLSKLFSATQMGSHADFERVGDHLLNQTIAGITQRMETPGEKLRGLPSGFMDVDRITGGFKQEEVTILAARPAMGKTALLVNVAVEIAVRRRIPVGIFSIEMSKEQLMVRVLSQLARVDSKLIDEGNLTEAQYNALIEAAGPIRSAPLFIDDDSGLDELSMMNKARTLTTTQGAKMILLDYLQLMTSATDRSGNREQEVSRISRATKRMARDLSIPVIACCQLNRDLEKREDKRPRLSDLRDSGTIEQDADKVIFLYRDEYYYGSKSEFPGLAEVIISKHRNGPTGRATLRFSKELTQFQSLTRRAG